MGIRADRDFRFFLGVFNKTVINRKMFTTRRFRDGMDRKVDDLESRIRRFMETKSGFENIQTQAQVLAQYLMGYDGRRDGCLTFEEFNAAMIGMNFVGTQFEIIALYQRYDVNGDKYKYITIFKYLSNSIVDLITTILQVIYTVLFQIQQVQQNTDFQ